MIARLLALCPALILPGQALSNPADPTQHIAIIQAVGPKGAGNPEAAAAFQALSEAKASSILPLLRAIEESNPIARNWLRSAVEVIIERELAAKKPLPFEELKKFLADRTQAPEARRLAFDLMLAIDRKTSEKLIPGFIDDPSTELRRDAVALLMTSSRKAGENATTYRKALDAARDVDQIQEIAKALAELKEEVDLSRHFGFLTNWQVIGPFHNSERKGFAEVFPPEKEVDLKASYEGKESEVTWQALSTDDPYGKVDFNKPYGKLKEVTGYAYHEFDAGEARPAELRLGCKNAWKIWLNGKLVFERDEYHRGQRIDQYKMPVELRKGTNSILLKLCQNEQKQDWTVQWEFQLRVCDATGTAILAANRPEGEPK
ncbi:MAG: hypothetical protein VX633_04205 [Verrucomicrobiota bacterium]|nr:hypothetical protein [Verrucomicrobiota bacterium]